MALFAVKKPQKPEPTSVQVLSSEERKIAQLIQQRRLQILVHSCLYYEMNKNIVSDFQFDMWSKELVVLQHNYPKISANVRYTEAFKDWDGSSGAFLPLREPWVMAKAEYVWWLHCHRNGGIQ